MAQVETVRGPVDASELGQTLAHEHVFVLTADVQQNWPDEWGDEEARIDDAVAKLTELADVGVKTIVDPTVVGLGRYIPRIQRVAERVPLNIVVATGIYTYNEVPHFFKSRGKGLDPSLPEPMVDLFVRDLTKGVADTGVKAAFLKCAVDEDGLTPGVERVMRAVAQAQLQTGAPVMVHTHPGTQQGLAVQRVLAEEGVAPEQVQLAHSGDSADVDHLSELADAGFLLGMDRFGLITAASNEQRIDTVAELCRRGYAGSMVLSHDTACYIDWAEPAARDWLPDWNYLYIHRSVLPALREQGVTDEQIDQMLVENPRRWLER
jgi:phosphotriesterase-related protein